MDVEKIKEATKQLSNLDKLIQLVDNVAIIEYDGKDINGCKALCEYILEQNLNIEIVKRVILLGKRCRELKKNREKIEELFPNCEVTVPNSTWHDVNPVDLKLRNTLVLHMTFSIGVIKVYNIAKLNRIIRDTCCAYSACYLQLNDEELKIASRLSLSHFVFTEQDLTPPTAYCKEKQEYIEMCMNSLTPKDAFFQCIDEVDHGCETCNQCNNYGPRKQCPMAQRRIAECYREGIYVPQDNQIAHQWELKASKQGYAPATIQVANDLRHGTGCVRDIHSALDLLLPFAAIKGNESSARQIIEIAEETPEIESIIAVPSIVRLANDGCEEMILKLSDAYLNGSWGLPKDPERHKSWVERGAENGSVQLIQSMAKMCEEKELWDVAYSCYEKLEENDVFADYTEKLAEIEDKIIGTYSDYQQLAEKGLAFYNGYGVEEIPKLAYACFLKSAEAGNALGEYGMASCYNMGKGVPKDKNKGKEWEEKAAAHGDIFAMMHVCRDLSNDENEDETENSKYNEYLVTFLNTLQAHIENDDARAYLVKGKCLEYGMLSFTQDYSAALECYIKATNLGNIYALTEVGDFYHDGLGVEKDYKTAYQWYEKAALKGCVEGIYDTGLAHYLGEGVPKNTSLAFNRLKRAAKRKHEYAMYYLAECYNNGLGTTKDKDKAYVLYKESAELDCELAMVKLCSDYFNGQYYNGTSYEKDYEMCIYWGEKALEKGETSIRFAVAYSNKEMGNIDRARELYTILANEEDNVAAMNNLGCLETDKTLSAEWFKKSADKGNRVAQLNIGRYYKNGTGVETDYSIAMDYFMKSADQDYPDSMHEIAMMYKYKQGIDEEEYPEKMIEWLKKASEKGFKPSMMELAALYKNGTIIDQDYQLALKYYMKVAEIDKTDDNQKDDSNKTKALYEIGTFYEYGYGVEINIHKAVYWYRKAANKNNWQAKEALRRLDTNWIDEQGKATNETNEIDDLPF